MLYLKYYIIFVLFLFKNKKIFNFIIFSKKYMIRGVYFVIIVCNIINI